MVIGSRTDGSRKFVSAHRMAYQEWNGPIGDNMVLHTCDNGRCINPKHLYLGDHAQNMRDMVERKRYKSFLGEDHVNATLTNQEVYFVKSLLVNTDMTCREIANQMGATRNVIKAISCGKSWAHIPEPPESDND